MGLLQCGRAQGAGLGKEKAGARATQTPRWWGVAVTHGACGFLNSPGTP